MHQKKMKMAPKNFAFSLMFPLLKIEIITKNAVFEEIFPNEWPLSSLKLTLCKTSAIRKGIMTYSITLRAVSSPQN